MFGLFKSNSNSSLVFKGNFKSNQKDFIERADEAYLLTFKQMDMSYFAKFASRNLYMMIYRSLTSERSWVGVSNKFKKVTWTMIEQDGGDFLASKDTIFDKVNVSKQLKLSVADDYRELWGITKNIEGNYTVERISEVDKC